MEEKVLIKSERYNVKKFFKIILIVGLLLTVAFFGLVIGVSVAACEFGWRIFFYAPLDYVLFHEFMLDPWIIVIGFSPIIVTFLLGGLIYLWLRSYELTVTDKRIYGKVAWGKRVDLPVDSVSATATLKLFKGVSVSTASGRISFLVIKNAEEIYNVISNLLINRQQEKNIVIEKAPVTDNADQLKKFKDLLDSGVITQEEFDAKKKQLLGL